MSYTLRPEPSGDTLVRSRDPIRTNFELIQNRFDENHVKIDGGVGGGKHKFLQMPEVPGGVPPTTTANELGFYSKVSTVTGNLSLFCRSPSSASEYQLTTPNDAQIATFGAAGTAAAGWTFLPGGLIMQWGFHTPTAALFGTVTFPFSFPTAIYSLQINPEFKVGFTGAQGSDSVSTKQITVNDFKYTTARTVNTLNYKWIAIGK